jgi:hypothetical protein
VRVATFAGQGIAYLLILAGFYLIFGGDILDGIWIDLIGWFLLSGAQSANSQAMLEAVFKGVTVSEVMNKSPNTAPANISLQKLVDELLLPYGWRSAFVMQGEFLAGLITLGDIRHIPRDEWAQTPVGLAMTPPGTPARRCSTTKLERRVAAHGGPGCEPGARRGRWSSGWHVEPRGHRALPRDQARTWTGERKRVIFA